MIIDGRTITEPLRARVCVVGAGPAGLTVADQLQDRNISVVILERGGVEPPAPNSPELMGEVGEGLPYFRLADARSMGIGGTSHLWPEEDGLRSRPLDPIDFEARKGVPLSGWPFARDELDSFYEAAQRICGLPARTYDVERWARAQTQPIDLGEGGFDTAMFKFGTDIGLFRSRRSTLERSAGVSVVINSSALGLVGEPSDPAQVRRIRVATPAGNEFIVEADIFVLAGGGIENPRILLLSRDPYELGLGNQHDLVGRFFQEHLRIHSGTLIPTSSALMRGLALYQRHIVDGYKTMGVLVPNADLVRRHDLLNSAVYLRPSSELRASHISRSIARLRDAGKDRWGPGDDPILPHLSHLAREPLTAFRTAVRTLRGIHGPPVVQLSLQTEQSPNPESKVSLGSARDRYGLPVANLEWRLNDIDMWSARRVQELLGQAVEMAGIGHVEALFGSEQPPVPVRGFWHHIGTTRMSRSPRSGVVDANCRIHGTNNVFVAGSSVFPTGGYANPTVTIVALAMRLSRHLVRIIETPVMGTGISEAEQPDTPEADPLP